MKQTRRSVPHSEIETSRDPQVETVGRIESDISPLSKSKTYAVKLTLRQRRYIRNRLAGKTKMDAALDAGYSLQMAHNAEQKIESCRAVRVVLEGYQEASLEREGLSDSQLREMAASNSNFISGEEQSRKCAP